MQKEILLITPPFTQLNTPYPATAYLKGFLNTKGISSFQMDLGIEVILELFSKQGLQSIFETAQNNNTINSENSQRIYALRYQYINTIEEIIQMLQGKNQSFAKQVCSGYLPQASRFEQADDLDWAFGTMGNQDKAKHLATLYLEDLSDFILECIDENFGFSRYAERLGRSANSFDILYGKLHKEESYIDKIALKILNNTINTIKPKLIGISVPFPGNLYSAFRSAQFIKKNHPGIEITMGGGFPTTELRSISDARVFDFFDYISLDNGELPLELIRTNILKKEAPPALPNASEDVQSMFKRTFLKENGKVVYKDTCPIKDYPQTELGCPDYSDLKLDKYISVIEIANPMHSLWSDGRWNKLTIAHGCYWGKCTFCDTTLHYIKAYEPLTAAILADRIEQIIAQTGEKGFHFVDEAAPPNLLKALALEIIHRKINIRWWANIRFEKNFTSDLCLLLKESGCIAVSGGLEVASDRLLALIQKGVSVEQVANVTNHFTEAGIMVHAYLMYGFPTQTIQETIDSLEMVRQLFELGIIQSGFWHQFALTAHSSIGKNPSQYNIAPKTNEITFANNDILFNDKTGINHDKFSFGLKKSLYNYMHGLGFEIPVQDWFTGSETGFKIPKSSIPKDYIQRCIDSTQEFISKPTSRIIWLGTKPDIQEYTKTKRGETRQVLKMSFHTKTGKVELQMDLEKGKWLMNALNRLSIQQLEEITFADLKADFETHFEDFELFWYSKPINTLRKNGMIVL